MKAGADIVVPDLAQLKLEGLVSKESRSAPVTNALTHFDEIRARLAGKRPSVFLDYDGTLTPIVARPDLAILSDDDAFDAARSCRRLQRGGDQRSRSGGRSQARRPRQSRLRGQPWLRYRRPGRPAHSARGERRFHRRGGARDREAPPGARRRSRARSSSRSALPSPCTTARSQPSGCRRSKRRSIACLRACRSCARREGKKVFELRPRFDWDKGKAVLWLLRALGQTGADILPFYIGDDLTDEDAFRALRDRGIYHLRRRPRPNGGALRPRRHGRGRQHS